MDDRMRSRNGGSRSGTNRNGGNRGRGNRKRVGIVAAKDSFFLSGLKSKLSDNGIDAFTVLPDIHKINEEVARNEPIIYFMGDEVFKHSSEEFLLGLKIMCLEQRKIVILIGQEAEYQMVTKTVPKSSIAEFYKRPVDMEKLMETLDKCYAGKVRVSGKKHILIVDDDTTFMRMMHESLKDTYKINMLTSGKQALLWLKENRPDLILLDYEMPEENGVAVYAQIKENAEFKDIPIIFLTGKQDKISVMNAIDLNPEDYILKSVDQQQLVDRLEDFFLKEVNKPGYVPGSQPSASAVMSEMDALFAEFNL